MARYYGVNNSELYGSNFSTVLADAPPPLDDTYEEDEHEIVFKNDGKKSKKYSEVTDASSIQNSHSSDKKLNDKSKYDGTLPNGGNQPEVEEDFGDFAGFADFGSAFGQENSEESQDWFASNENNSVQDVKAINSQQGDDEEYAGFATFQDSLNQESIPNGGSDQANSNPSDFYHNKNGLGNRNISSNGSYDKESDDDEFGDFAESSPQNDSKNILKIQTDPESTSGSQRRTCSESNKESNSVDVDNTRNIVHCNGDLVDKKSVSHLGESIINHVSESVPNDNKGIDDSPRKVSMSEQENEFGTKRGTENAKNSSSTVIKDEESRPLDDFSVDDYQPSESSVAVPEIVEDQIKTNREGDGTDTILSNNNGKEQLESTIKSSETNCSKGHVSDSSACAHGSEAKILPENNELPVNDDGFGEFADSIGPAVKQSSIDNDGGEEEISKETPDSPGMCAPIGGEGDEPASSTGAASVQDKDDDDDDFGDFGSFGEKHDQNNERTDFVATDSEAKCLSNDDDVDDFGDFGTSNPEQKTLPTEDQSNDFGDFGTFDSSAKDSNKDDDNDDDFGDFGVSNPEQKTLPIEDQGNDDFGDFGTTDSSAKDSNKDDGNSDDFGDFGTSNSEGKTLPTEDQNDDFGDFGTFDSSVKHSPKGDVNSDDDFGDFGTFNSSAKDSRKDDINDDSFGNFGAFDAQANDSLETNESDNEFGDFGTVESKVKDVTKGDQRNNSNLKDLNAVESKDDNKFGDFRTSDSAQDNQTKKNLQNDEFGAFNSPSKNVNNSRETDADFGDFSAGNEGKASSFAPRSSVSSESSPRKNVDLQQKRTETLYFVPGGNVIIKQAGDPVSLCFTSAELRHISDCRCDVLSSRVGKSLQSNLGVWQQLEHTDKEGRRLFHWSNSFSQHKKFLSLTIRPDRPPPLQGGSMLKPMVSSQFVPFGGGLAGSMLMPESPRKLPHFSSTLPVIKAFLEPVKGSQIPVHSTAQEKIGSHHSVHPEIGLPDLSFVLGNGLKRTASKSDIKDNVSDTASESSSLDLDFFAPSTTQPSNGKSDSRGLYEEDMLGLNIFSSSLEPQKIESPKLQTKSDTKKVWQHGGVTIPLSSQESRAQLSAAAKNILDELEDLKFMRSSVLMFPLKPE